MIDETLKNAYTAAHEPDKTGRSVTIRRPEQYDENDRRLIHDALTLCPVFTNLEPVWQDLDTIVVRGLPLPLVIIGRTSDLSKEKILWIETYMPPKKYPDIDIGFRSANPKEFPPFVYAKFSGGPFRCEPATRYYQKPAVSSQFLQVLTDDTERYNHHWILPVKMDGTIFEGKTATPRFCAIFVGLSGSIELKPNGYTNYYSGFVAVEEF